MDIRDGEELKTNGMIPELSACVKRAYWSYADDFLPNHLTSPMTAQSPYRRTGQSQ